MGDNVQHVVVDLEHQNDGIVQKDTLQWSNVCTLYQLKELF
jgi:hypothetical protein